MFFEFLLFSKHKISHFLLVLKETHFLNVLGQFQFDRFLVG